MRKANLCRAFVALLAVAACGDPTGPQYDSVELSWLTEDLTGALDSQGRFVFPPTVQLLEEIPEPRARELAIAFAHWIGIASGNMRANLEKSYGGRIAWQHLDPCDRAFLTTPSYGLGSQHVISFIKRGVAANWVVPMCARNASPQIVISVSALTTNVQIADGIIQFQFFLGGGEFAVQAVPRGNLEERFLQPERVLRSSPKLPEPG